MHVWLHRGMCVCGEEKEFHFKSCHMLEKGGYSGYYVSFPTLIKDFPGLLSRFDF